MEVCRRGGSFFRLFSAGAGGLLLAALAGAASGTTTATQLADLSLEQLSDLVVGTVSRFDERLDGAAASVFIITADDIRRSGATTLPQVLRLAPTLDIARANSSQYAISARGFANVLANKTLVLIDGRTLYTPLFSGVFWEAQDIVLEDIDRIEVITGPSTALWGSNAVNALIHVITRSAAATQSTLAQARIGNREHVGVVRQGFALGQSGHLRAYAKAYDRDASQRADGSSFNDSSKGQQLGFRADWALAAGGLTVQGNFYQGEVDQLPSARTFSGVNLLARWEQQLAASTDLTLQAHAERTRRDHPQTFRETLDTVDVIAEVGLRPLEGHRVLLGAGVRQSQSEVTNFNALAFVPARRELVWTRLFVQDQIALSPTLTATVSTSLEKNPYTGTEVLPSLRLAWRPVASGLAWAGLSRAVRAPSRIDREVFQPAQPPYT
ncbi:MAG TPA: TonB-dependent receptor, partial [Rubrivivax sp.]|nr:TonB-dependent receptor [Rubrivivax sp.]